MIEVAGLGKNFQSKAETVTAVSGLDFEAGPGEVVTLLGPSGCGKTTTLRCIAGLERPTSGRIAISGRDVVNCDSKLFVPPHQRRLGMVFQSYAIWPHMSVIENVAYALEGKKISKADRVKQAMRALDIVQMTHLADRPAPRLSGGQQQRVAIARAIVGSPQALLFDEPLSNLDAQLRSEMRNELRRLQQRTGLTSIYVTHDQTEALAISDWIIVMKDGAIVERGRPRDIYRAPKTVFSATFLGSTNLIPGTIEERLGAMGHVAVSTAIGRLIGVDPTRSLTTGSRVYASFRPEDLILSATGVVADRGDGENGLDGVLDFVAFGGAVTEAEVRCGSIKVQCILQRDLDLSVGDLVRLRFPPEVCLVLADD